MNWAGIEQALWTWVVGASQLPGTQVIWSEQNGPRPNTPFIAMSIAEVRQIGIGWVDGQYAASTYTALSRGVRECTLRLQCFGASPVGDQSPRAILELVQTRGNLDSLHSGLMAAGIGMSRFEPMIVLGAELNQVVFEPRAIINAHFFLAAEETETSNYIETVEITDEIDGRTITVTT